MKITAFGFFFYPPKPKGQEELAVIQPFFWQNLDRLEKYKLIDQNVNDRYSKENRPYIRQGWNLLDFIIVISGLIEAADSFYRKNLGATMDEVQGSPLSALRVVRILRPLQLISGVPSLQTVLNSLLKSMKPLCNIFIFITFWTLMYAIIGLEMYSGVFHQQCYDLDENGQFSIPTEQVCQSFNHENKSAYPKPYDSVSGLDPYTCDPGQLCNFWDTGPNVGITKFDNIFSAMLTIFQSISLEGWTDVLFYTIDANGKGSYNWHLVVSYIFFTSLILIGRFVMLNLILGVLAGEFTRERDRRARRENFLKKLSESQTEADEAGYLNWIATGETLHEFDENKNLMTKSKLTKKQRMLKKLDSFMSSDSQTSGVVGKTFDLIRARIVFYNLTAKKLLRNFFKSDTCFWVIIILIFLNTVAIALPNYSTPKWLLDVYDRIEIMFLIVFTAEIILKIYAFGIRIYFGKNQKFNYFDFILVFGSWCEWLAKKYLGYSSLCVSVLRSLRLLKVFKKTSEYRRLTNTVSAFMDSIKSIASLLLLLALFVLVFALLGMQLYGGKIQEDVNEHFDNFFHASLTVFQVVIGCDWNEIMYVAVDSMGGHIIWALYFVVVLTLGNFTLLNIFLAIALNNLEDAEEKTKEQDKEDARKREKALADAAQFTKGSTKVRFEEMSLEGTTNSNKTRQSRKNIMKQRSTMALDNTACLCLTGDNALRQFFHKVLNSRWFEPVVLVTIFLSSVSLAAENPVDDHSSINGILKYCDYVFTAIFTFEMIVKMIALGVIGTSTSYFRDFWNLLDFVVVTGALSEYAFLIANGYGLMEEIDMGMIKSLRILRVLRTLKTIDRMPSLKCAFLAVLKSVKKCKSVLLIYTLFMCIFSVLGVKLQDVF